MVFLSCERNVHFWNGQEATIGFRTVGKWSEDEELHVHDLWDCLR